MIDRPREIELMREALAEARKSQSEDGRIHPFVGALIVDVNGEVRYRSHRGEDGGGGHAEYNVLRKAAEDNGALENTSMFVTLEPCTRRGLGKVPCAVRIAAAGVERLYIGTLDPNPHITGRGEMFLSGLIQIERFTGEIIRELVELNDEFFAQHAHAHVPVISPYAGGDESQMFKPVLATQREGLLQQSMDLITGTSGAIWIFSGGMSWLRELQISLLVATLAKRQVRILCDPQSAGDDTFMRQKEIARALGADVAIGRSSFSLRGTIAREARASAMIAVERRPALHGALYQSPHDSSMLELSEAFFERMWAESDFETGASVKLAEISVQDLGAALKLGVPAYERANISHRKISTESLLRLPRVLERFKLFRLNQLAALQQQTEFRVATHIQGSPWLIKPPVVEHRGGDTFVVVDGAHRAYSAYSRGQRELDVLLVENVSSPLPAEALRGWDDVEIITGKVPREQRYTRFDESNFRPIRSAFEALAMRLALEN